MKERKLIREYWRVFSDRGPWSREVSLDGARRAAKALREDEDDTGVRIAHVTVYQKPRITEADVAKAVKDELWRVTEIFERHARGEIHWTKSVARVADLLREGTEKCPTCGGEGFVHVSVATMTCPTCGGAN